MEISSEWTEEERMQVATRIAEKLRAKAEEGPLHVRLVTSSCDRIINVLNGSGNFLEANRDLVLLGAPMFRK